jgi:excisionase family DNA binding protein
MKSENNSTGNVEPFITIVDAAKRLGLPTFKVRRAVKAGLIPSYRIANGRVLVRLSEVVAAIEASRIGGIR